MTEKTLRDYFDGEIDSDELSIDLKDSQKRTSYDVTTYYLDKLEEGEFEVTREHLVKLCDEVISGKLSATDLNTIAFAIIASDYFTWDGHSIEGGRVANVIFEWENPEIGYDITVKNVRLWKEYLLTGEYRLDKNELKQKFRSKGKYKVLYQSIDEILWTEWDPIRVNDVTRRDEYQIYTPTILNLRIKNADTETIANKLHDIETKIIGVRGDITRCRAVAERISKL
jgi:hypothetical protein